MMKVFISYCHEDEISRIEIEKFLVILTKQKLINIWSDRKIDAGSELHCDINKNLEESNIILPLISQDFLNSHYCYEIEMARALEKHSKNEAVVIPIILRPCDWLNTPIKDLLALPKDGKPITLWDNKDLAYLDITQGIRAVISKMTNEERTLEPLMVLGTVKGTFKGKVIEGTPYIKNNRTYMSVVYVANRIGVQKENIIWDDTKGTLILIKNDLVIQITVGSNILLINGIEITMDVQTEFINGIIMLPPTYIAQAFGANVFWDNSRRTLMIEKWS